MSVNMEERVGLTGSEKWVSVYPQSLFNVPGIVNNGSMLVRFMFIFIEAAWSSG